MRAGSLKEWTTEVKVYQSSDRAGRESVVLRKEERLGWAG
jgi:hypothetical protein